MRAVRRLFQKFRKDDGGLDLGRWQWKKRQVSQFEILKVDLKLGDWIWEGREDVRDEAQASCMKTSWGVLVLLRKWTLDNQVVLNFTGVGWAKFSFCQTELKILRYMDLEGRNEVWAEVNLERQSLDCIWNQRGGDYLGGSRSEMRMPRTTLWGTCTGKGEEKLHFSNLSHGFQLLFQKFYEKQYAFTETQLDYAVWMYIFQDDSEILISKTPWVFWNESPWWSRWQQAHSQIYFAKAAWEI